MVAARSWAGYPLITLFARFALVPFKHYQGFPAIFFTDSAQPSHSSPPVLESEHPLPHILRRRFDRSRRPRHPVKTASYCAPARARMPPPPFPTTVSSATSLADPRTMCVAMPGAASPLPTIAPNAARVGILVLKHNLLTRRNPKSR